MARYTPGGSLQWVRTLAKASDASSFAAAAADAAGNLYAVGTIDGTGECSFGSGVSVAGAVAGQNAVIVKYGPTGLVLWARTVSSAASQTGYSAVAVDVSGSVYAVGHTTGSGAYGFGGSVTVKGTANKDKRNALLVKYDSSGAALWAWTSSGKAGAEFTAVAADATRNAYVLGSLAGAERYGFGGKVSANASGNGDSVLVLYDASGAVQWDDTFPASAVSSMAVDSQGGIYLGGYLEAGVKATLEDGSAASAPDAYGAGVLVKYDPAGKVGWIEATNDPQDDGGLRRLVIDSNGGIYALGSKENGAFLVRFGADGRRVWSQSIDPFMEIREGDIDREGFYAMAADPHGALYVVGVHTTVDVADYGLLGRY